MAHYDSSDSFVKNFDEKKAPLRGLGRFTGWLN
jgi:hypothetical protein